MLVKLSTLLLGAMIMLKKIDDSISVVWFLV
jgi:hypothetical protein